MACSACARSVPCYASGRWVQARRWWRELAFTLAALAIVLSCSACSSKSVEAECICRDSPGHVPAVIRNADASPLPSTADLDAALGSVSAPREGPFYVSILGPEARVSDVRVATNDVDLPLGGYTCTHLSFIVSTEGQNSYEFRAFVKGRCDLQILLPQAHARRYWVALLPARLRGRHPDIPAMAMVAVDGVDCGGAALYAMD